MKSWFFISQLNLNVTEENVKNYIKGKCKTSNVTVQSINEDATISKAFKVGIEQEHQNDLQKPEFWPQDVKVQKYLFFLEKRLHQKHK